MLGDWVDMMKLKAIFVLKTMEDPYGYGSKLSTPKMDGFPARHDQKSVGHWYHNGLSQSHIFIFQRAQALETPQDCHFQIADV